MPQRRLAFAPVAVLIAVIAVTAVLVVTNTRVHTTSTGAHVWPLPAGRRQACRGTVTLDCVRRTAGRVGHEVAWVGSGSAVTAEGVVYQRRQASVELSFGAPTGLLDSAPGAAADAPNLPRELHHGGSYRFTVMTVNGSTLRVLTTAAGGIAFTKLTWTHHGLTFSLGETTSGTTSPEVAPLVALWQQVRYASAAASS